MTVADTTRSDLIAELIGLGNGADALTVAAVAQKYAALAQLESVPTVRAPIVFFADDHEECVREANELRAKLAELTATIDAVKTLCEDQNRSYETFGTITELLSRTDATATLNTIVVNALEDAATEIDGAAVEDWSGGGTDAVDPDIWWRLNGMLYTSPGSWLRARAAHQAKNGNPDV